jgi:general secretion pathway protein J
MSRARAVTRTWKPRRNSGFTLFEFLISLALIALVTGTIAGGLRLGQRAWETSKRDEARGEIEAASRALGEMISRAWPAVARKSEMPALVFEGRKNQLILVASSEGEAQRAGLLNVEVAIEDHRGQNILSTWSGVFRAETAWSIRRSDMRRTEILKDVAGLEFSYFGAATAGRPPAWSEEWVARDRLPDVVAIRFIAIRGGRNFETSAAIGLRVP